MIYEPGSIECRVLLDCKEKVISIQHMLASLEKTIGSNPQNICDNLSDIYKNLITCMSGIPLKNHEKS